MAQTQISESPALSHVSPDGPPGRPVVGNMNAMLADGLGFLQEVAERYGDVARYRIGPWTWYQVNHPDGVRRILQENHHNYIKGKLYSSRLKPVIGNSLLVSNGDFWLRQRRLMQPAFHRQRIAGFGEMMVGKTLAKLEKWEHVADTDAPLEVDQEMFLLTRDIVTRALFTTQVRDESNVVGEAISVLSEDTNFRFLAPFYPPPPFPTIRNLRWRRALQALRAVVDRIVADRREGKTQGDDLLSMLMEMVDEETGEGMDDDQLRNELITLFIAGHETTANTLIWTFYLLAGHPEVEAQLHAELDRTLGDRPPSLADLSSLNYTRMVLEEAMRLYPPAWVTNREAVAEDEVCGYPIPAGATVILSPYVVQRLPAFWPEPERFDPQRFSADASQDRPRFAYFPFGGGPHQCIGKDFALVEAQLILATISQRYRLERLPGYEAEPEALVTLRPRGGLPMRVVRRGGKG